MKNLTKSKLKQLIKEEIAILFEQDEEDESKYRGSTGVDDEEEDEYDEDEYDEEGNYIGPEPDWREEPLDVEFTDAPKNDASKGTWDEEYRQELMQHFIDKEGYDEDEAAWAVNEMDPGYTTPKGRTMTRHDGDVVGPTYSPDEHFLDTYEAHQVQKQASSWLGKAGKSVGDMISKIDFTPASIKKTLKTPVTSSATQSMGPVDTEYTASITDPDAKRIYGSDIMPTTHTEDTGSAPRAK